jgi:hypothetical protein
MKRLVLTLAVVSLTIASYADERPAQPSCVAAAKSSVVSIIEENTKTGEWWEGTGWFITGNRIVTNDHLVNEEEGIYDRLTIVNVGTGEHYTLNRIAYQDAASDVAIIVINESNATHLNLSKLNPVKGMDVVVIGNPKHVRGTVTTGKITDVEDLGNDKWINAIYLDAGLQEGNSGSPILDSNGDVLGMVWGAKGDGSGSGVAVTAKTLKLQVVDAAPRAELVVVPRAERVVPRALTSVANAQDFNNWTTESLKLIFIPPTHITRIHGKIKTVTFLAPPGEENPRFHALELFHLIFMFLFGPKEESNPHMHNLEDGDTPGVIAMKDPETGYLVTRDDVITEEKVYSDSALYHFTVSKDGATVLTAELVGPKEFVLYIK